MENTLSIRQEIALTAFFDTDQPNLIQHLNDPVIFQNTSSIPSPYSETHAAEWVTHTESLLVQYGQRVQWAIRHSEYGVIGAIGAFVRTGLDGHADEIGYWLAQNFRSQGIMTDAVRVFCAWMFEQRPSLVRIEAKVFDFNAASVRVLEKAGFVQEGTMRKATLKQGQLIDVVLLAQIR